MKSIVIVKLGALGDIFDTITYLTDLSEKSDVTFIVHERFSGPLKFFCPQVRILEVNEKSIFSLMHLVATLVRKNFPKIVIFQINIKFALFFKIFSPLSEVLSFRAYIEQIQSQNVSRPNLERNMIRRLIGIYPEVGLPIVSGYVPSPEVRLSTSPSSHFNTIVCLGVGGGNRHDDAKNRILTINFIKNTVAKIGITLPLKVKIILLGNGAADQARAELLLSYFKNDPDIAVISMVNKTNLGDLQYILSKSKLFLGPDSFIAKLAGMFSPKAFVFLGPTNPKALAYDASSTVFLTPNLNEVPCSPCHSPCLGRKSLMFTCQQNICMESHQANDVVEYLLH